ncbi:MAG: hypothetical protein JWQ09_282 [Segetibacter sp.]|nr:hypothetical protein [Segetibacter sp.]
MFIPAYSFKVQIPKSRLLEFVANVPPELYFFFVPKVSGAIYGYLVSDDLVEYFLNEFPAKDFQIITMDMINQIANKPGYDFWGDNDLFFSASV